jgi:polar amino acid transport system permease protein
MPQALRVIIPPLGNTFNGLLKTSSLASVISMEELLRRSEVLVQAQFKVLEIYIITALYYLVLTTLWGLVQQRIEAYFARSVAPPTGGSRGTPVLAPTRRIEEMLLSRDAQ